jgi:hypothetical protein
MSPASPSMISMARRRSSISKCGAASISPATLERADTGSRVGRLFRRHWRTQLVRLAIPLGHTHGGANGEISATLTFAMPPTPGQYQFRLFSNYGWTLLGTSGVVTVCGATIDDGACGAATRIPASSAPTANLCSSGNRFAHKRRWALVVELRRNQQYRTLFGVNCRGRHAHNHCLSRVGRSWRSGNRDHPKWAR